MKVLIRKSVLQTIDQIADHIIYDVQMPDTALNYAEKLIEFGYSLGKYPYAYPLCRNTKLAQNKFRCAVFNKKWIFVYRVSSKSVIIHQLIWGGRMK